LLPACDFQKKIQSADGLSYVIAPSVQSKEYNISFDAVEISRQTSSAKTVSHIPITISPKENVSQHEKLSFVVTCLIVSQLQHATFEFGKIIYGAQSKSLKLRLLTYSHEAQKILRALRKILYDENVPRFYHNNYCKVCEFQEVCQAVLIEKDDISLLGRISEKEVLKRNNRGIFTIHQLSYTFRPRRKRKNTSPKNAHFLWELKALALREQRTYIQEIPKLSQSGIDIYLDFEGLPDEHFYYLIGVIINTGKTEKQMSFWANSPAEEEAIFRQLFDVLSKFKEFTVYHYGAYEIQALKKINKKLRNAYEHDINRIIQHSVNILSFIASNVYLPTYTNELKEVANFLGFTWSDAEASGIQSIVWRKRWEFTHDDAYKSKLVQYNIEDCLALQLTKEWLQGLERNVEQRSSEDIVKAEEVKANNKYPHTYCHFRSLLEDFEKVNKYAYFEYQRERIFLKTNMRIQKAMKRRERKRHPVGKINQIIKTPHPKKCPQCHHDKVYRLDSYTKTMYDLKFFHTGIKKWVTQFVGMGFRCPKCRKSFIPESNKQIHKYGHNLMSWAVNQHIKYRVSEPNVAQIVSESFGIPLRSSTIANFKTAFAEIYAVTYREIQQYILHGSLLHVDETCVEVKGFPSSYVWVFTNMVSVFYLFKPNREAEFLKKLLEGFSGVLVSDFYPGYDSLPCAQQKCLIHLLRDLNNDLFKHQFDLEFKELVVHFGQLLRTIMDTIHRYGLKQRHLHKHRKDVDKFYAQIINKEYESELAISYQKRFQKNQDRLFTFLDYDGIPWNNNNAEHAIKPFGFYRNIADGLFTEKSIKKYLVLLSVQQTCEYREIGFLKFLLSKEKSVETYTKKH
jgi:predicted RecB family nuclease